MENMNRNLRRQVGALRVAVLCLIVISICLVIGLIVVAVRDTAGSSSSGSIATCGSAREGDEDPVIDMTEPDEPGPFHDLTRKEIQALRIFLEKDENIRAVKAEGALLNDSVIFIMDLINPKKSEVLEFLDENRKQPTRQARVVMFRGDLETPRVEEYICGPLPKVSECSMLQSPNRRNPVKFSLRPYGFAETDAIVDVLLPKVDEKIGHILQESFGTSFVNCKPNECFKLYQTPVGTNLVNDVSKRLLWLWADYPINYYALHPIDLALLADVTDSDPEKMVAVKVWYNNQLFDSLDEFVTKYESDDLEKIKIPFPKEEDNLFSTLRSRGTLFPEKPKRPPTLVEPDGKRYTVKDKKVQYLDWTFNFRMSALTGPGLFDIRYRNERIAYEISLAELAVFYSGYNPIHRATDYLDSEALLGVQSKALVPGGDCPETATFINLTFSGQSTSEPVENERAFCLFENNNGYPLRRHAAYSAYEGGFYGGMLDSVLTLRSSLTVVNYDYIIDFIFHQNGVVETRVMSTGYIFPAFYNPNEDNYGFRIKDNLLGNLHHHLWHFKVDLDIGGTSNRYETLDISTEEVKLRVKPHNKYYQTKYTANLREYEKDALYKFDFDHPKYHVVHNNKQKTKFDEIKAYRIGLNGMSKQVLPEGYGNEVTIPWARHQLVVTKHKDDEALSSSLYAQWDSADPVTNFSKFYDDNDRIVDEDLVFWISEGMHHIPHTEDLPVTPTVGNHVTFFLFPYNYFEECPSVSSRDQIFMERKDKSDPAKGWKIDRNGNSEEQCRTPQLATEFDRNINPPTPEENQEKDEATDEDEDDEEERKWAKL